jgi:hypothetical protein
MKKSIKLLLITNLLILNIQSIAQITYGPKLGLNFSRTSGKYSSNDEASYRSLTGMQIGGILNYALDENFSIQPELFFSQKGWIDKEITGNQNVTTTKTKFRLNYLEIPILIKYCTGNDLKYYANAGPYLGFLLGGNYKRKATTDIGGTTVSAITKGKFKFKTEPDNYDGNDMYFESGEVSRVDVGMQIGGGIGKDIGPGVLYLDLRYAFGLTDFYKDKYFDPIGRPNGYKKFQNRTFSLSLIYILN